jgi:hypothetical protein
LSTGSTIATGASAAALACRRRAPRVRLAYQPCPVAAVLLMTFSALLSKMAAKPK